MLTNGLNTNALNTCKASILDISNMQGDFDIVERHFLDFIAMNPSLQKNDTDKLSSSNRSSGGRGGGRGSDRVSSMPAESDVQVAMNAINNKYFLVSERGYIPTAKSNNVYNAEQQAVYRICEKQDSISRPDARAGNSKEYADSRLRLVRCPRRWMNCSR